MIFLNKTIKMLLAMIFLILCFLPKNLKAVEEKKQYSSWYYDYIQTVIKKAMEEAKIKESITTLRPDFTYQLIPKNIEEKIKGKSYKNDCEIPLEDLRYVKVKYWGYDNVERVGELIVNTAVAKDTVEIFAELYDARYPIEKIRLIDEYNADDNISMSDNNSSAFNYRTIVGTNRISKHGKGLAIDINPLYNPYVFKDKKGDIVILPPEGELYLDRSRNDVGMIKENDVCYNAFIQRGWTWGGHFKNSKDYQHFEKNIE